MPTTVMPSKRPGGPAEVTGGPSRGSLAAPRGAGMMIQVAATGSKADAEKMVKALQTLSYRAVLVTPHQARASDNLYRVQIGPYATRETAEKIRDRLIQDGFKQPFIKH